MGDKNINTEYISNDKDLRAKTYFLKQGQNIAKLNKLLYSRPLFHHIDKWFSLTIEIVFYLLFIFLLVIAILLPHNLEFYFPGYGLDNISIGFNNEYVTSFFFVIKILILLLSVPLPILARMLALNRKKNKLIHEAFLETEKMKQEFETALRDLEL